LGSYSHALPGHADARSALAAPIDERIFFAGEACSPHDFSTAHGAYEPGVAAARAFLASR
ncbi:MAG: FAD-dependent oxidoreductase, partial [Methylobacteriaceae bacterium]|nr:FAD-dependent oxidoreductase [Methylobacteriaceae bacterium]